MASLTAVRALCSIGVTLNLPLRHSDIPQAFIQSKLDSDESWMKLPRGVELVDRNGNTQHIRTIHITQITRSHASQITQIIQITQFRLVMLHWTGGYLGPGGVREILPYPSTLVGCPSPLLPPILFRHIQA